MGCGCRGPERRSDSQAFRRAALYVGAVNSPAVAAPEVNLTSKQWAVLLLIAAVQFVNILDFVIVMPMGPELAAQLGFSKAHVGYINGAYTAAASLMGFLGSFFLDRFDRRTALAVSLVGLVLGTLA